MRYIGWGLFVIAVVVLPNLTWLYTSTVRLHNAATTTIPSVAYSACNERQEIGDLRPSESEFFLLAACGDDTLIVYAGDTEHCRLYVEGELYHVDATIEEAGTIRCGYDGPLSSLFIGKALF